LLTSNRLEEPRDATIFHPRKKYKKKERKLGLLLTRLEVLADELRDAEGRKLTNQQQSELQLIKR
jgi:hypothetical protein